MSMLGFDLETWREVAQSLARRRVRTLLTAWGVAWGMFMLIVALACGHAFGRGVMNSLGEYSNETAWIWAERTTMAHAGHPPGRGLSIRRSDLAALESSVPGLAALSPRNHLGDDEEAPVSVRRGDRHGSFAVTGEDFDVRKMRPIVVEHGRFMNPLDVAQQRKIAFLGRSAAERLFTGTPEPGATITLQGVEFLVGGVFRLSHGGRSAEQQENAIIIPWTTLAQTFGPFDRISAVALLAEPHTDPAAMAGAARRILRRRHDVHPRDEMAFGEWSPYRDAQRFLALFTAIDVLLWVVGVFTVLAGTLGVGNIMLVSVRERLAEIGVRKAVGATTGNIVGQFAREAIVLVLAAGGVGIGLGIAVIGAIRRYIEGLPLDERPEVFLPPEVELSTAVLGLGALCFAALVASLLPARAAAAVRPARVLQTE